MKKKKILYIGNQLQHSGLTPTTIDTLAPKLVQEGYEVVTFSKKTGFTARMWDMMVGVLNNRDADFVLIDTYSTKAFWFCFVISQLCRLLGLKYIPYLHGGNLPHRLDKNPYCAELIFNNSFKNVAPSGFLKHEFEKRNFKNVTFIPNYIEIKNYPFQINKQDSPQLLWVRSFAAIYNPALAVEVLEEVVKLYPQASLCMVGPDKDGTLEQIRKLAHLKKLNVTFTGKLTKIEWIALAKDFNFFLNTTNFDNTPVSVIEAMALGIPVVSTNVGGLPFIIKDKKDGYLVPPNNKKEMVACIITSFKNKNEENQITIQARLKAESWDWSQVKNKWNTLFTI